MEDERSLANEVLHELEQLRSSPAEAQIKIGAIREKAQVREIGFESHSPIKTLQAEAWLAISALAKAIDEGQANLADKWASAIEKTKIWATA
jgi:hypothetical protein